MMSPGKMAELGEAMSAALSAAVAANPNDNLAVHRALWDQKQARIAELEAALRAIFLAADTASDEQEWADMVSAAMTDERRALITSVD